MGTKLGGTTRILSNVGKNFRDSDMPRLFEIAKNIPQGIDSTEVKEN